MNNNNNSVIDPRVIDEFSGNLGEFNSAMRNAQSEINRILQTPGIESETITIHLTNLKNKLEEMSTKWDEILTRTNSELKAASEEAARLEGEILKTTE